MSRAEFAKNAASVLKTVEGIKAAIVKQHGPGSAMLLGDRQIEKIDVIPTGSIGLDKALGVGGWPRGRIVEIYGDTGVSKTTLMLHAIAQAQKLNIPCGYVDAEHALDVSYAKNLGVRAEELLLSQPDCGEQAFDIVEQCIRGECGLVVVDSVAALTPRAEIEGDFGDATMGGQARLMGQAMRKLTSLVSKHATTLLFVNQTRQRIGIVYGPTTTTTGGNALKFYTSVRCELARIGSIKQGDEITGTKIRVKVVKNKMSVPFKEAVYDLRFGHGIDKEAELVDIADELKLVERAGSWYSYGEERVQGRDGFVKLLREKPELKAKIEKQVRSAI